MCIRDSIQIDLVKIRGIKMKDGLNRSFSYQRTAKDQAGILKEQYEKRLRSLYEQIARICESVQEKEEKAKSTISEKATQGLKDTINAVSYTHLTLPTICSV
eukprot:TRINITY_DN13220_c0_g1_i3.p1 TRINITY_DN13220_c0_g1~~TRINITY_DN13220_c0_g1_i3.p1  ORF type:complete len:102 (-),score=15.84 TRINITY_DN13220_c0_g1_i3:34-339(-)